MQRVTVAGRSAFAATEGSSVLDQLEHAPPANHTVPCGHGAWAIFMITLILLSPFFLVVIGAITLYESKRIKAKQTDGTNSPSITDMLRMAALFICLIVLGLLVCVLGALCL